MPKMTYIKGERVRAGSWSTKSFWEKWKLTYKQLENAELMTPRLEHLLLNKDSESSQICREAYEDEVIWRLEYLRDQINLLLGKFPKHRRAEALENVTGRTPEEAAAFKAKAKALRESIDHA